jgi:hypothetical protein
MPPKSRSKKPVETSTSPQDAAVNTRSIYGDNRAATEDALMLAHTQRLYSNNIIDDEMATQLSQPWHKSGELKLKYTKEYLELHPDYTGKDAHDMLSLEWAMRKRKENDRKMEKWIEDWRAGKIDDNGDPIGDYSESSSSSSLSSGEEDGYQDGDVGSQEDHTSDTTLSIDEDDEVWLGQLPPVEATKDTGSGPGAKDNASKHTGTTKTESSELPKHTDHRHAPLRPHLSDSPGWSDCSSSPRSTSPVPSSPRRIFQLRVTSEASTNSSSRLIALPSQPSTSSSSAISIPKPKPARKRNHATPSPLPLAPHPGNPTYEGLDYWALIGICRMRNLSSGGRMPFVRNRIIQDDTNVALGLEQALLKNARGRRKHYKHAVPVDLAGGSSSGTGDGSSQASHGKKSPESSGNKGSESGGEVVKTRNLAGSKSEKEERVEALGRKEESESGSGSDSESESESESEDAFEVLTGPRMVKRKRGVDGEEAKTEAKRIRIMG